MSKKVFLLSTTVLILIGVAFLYGSIDKNEIMNKISSSDFGSRLNLDKRKVYQYGDILSNDDIEIEVSNARDVEEEDWFITPKNGNKYIEIEVSVKNKTDNELTFNVNDTFSLKDTNANYFVYEETNNLMTDDVSINNVTIPGRSIVRGVIVYEVGATESEFKLGVAKSVLGREGVNFSFKVENMQERRVKKCL